MKKSLTINKPAGILGLALLAGLMFLETALTPRSPATDKKPAGMLTIRFAATVRGQPFQLHKNYTNPFGETFKLDLFRFYAGKLTLSRNGDPVKKIFTALDYHLIDLADSSTAQISFSVPEGVYDKVLLQLGIDSADQTSGAQTGALDPLRGMFWTWNSGYLSLKLEGVSPESNAAAHAITYHIGGYRHPNETTRSLALGLPGNQRITLPSEASVALEIHLDLDLFFSGSTPVHIRDLPACTTPGILARSLFENFTGSFTGIQLAKQL